MVTPCLFYMNNWLMQFFSIFLVKLKLFLSLFCFTFFYYFSFLIFISLNGNEKHWWCSVYTMFSNAWYFHGALHKCGFVTIVGVSQCNQCASHVISIDTSNTMKRKIQPSALQKMMKKNNNINFIQFQTLIQFYIAFECVDVIWNCMTLISNYVLLYMHNRWKCIPLNQDPAVW